MHTVCRRVSGVCHPYSSPWLTSGISIGDLSEALGGAIWGRQPGVQPQHNRCRNSCASQISAHWQSVRNTLGLTSGPLIATSLLIPYILRGRRCFVRPSSPPILLSLSSCRWRKSWCSVTNDAFIPPSPASKTLFLSSPISPLPSLPNSSNPPFCVSLFRRPFRKHRDTRFTVRFQHG